MTFDEVRACLENDGWPVDKVSEVTMRSRFRSGGRVFPLFVHLEPDDRSPMGETPKPPPAAGELPAVSTYATFAVIPFARLPPDEAGDLLADRLLVLNREMNLAKFSVDEDGDVILSVEYPLADLDPSEVRDAVDVLSFYAEKYRAEIQAAVIVP
jgi:hypothetical protein